MMTGREFRVDLVRQVEGKRGLHWLGRLGCGSAPVLVIDAHVYPLPGCRARVSRRVTVPLIMASISLVLKGVIFKLSMKPDPGG